MTPRAVFRYSAAAIGTAAAVAAVGIVAVTPSATGRGAAGPAVAADPWVPQPFGLDSAPDDLLPTRIGASTPVSVVSTVLDDTGRPVVTTHRATGRAAAAGLIRSAQQAPHALGVELDVAVHAEAITGGDTYRGSQWDITTLDATTAWGLSSGAGATVAVIDTGVDATHPDLAGRLLTGVDLITDTEGAAIDPHGHGTHVAGTIAAATGNELGVSGFAPDAMILPIRVLDSNGSGVMSDVATGLIEAADRGADVANLSLGSTGQAGSVTAAVGYARGKGVVIVAASGNSRASGSPTNYPAADAGVIGVAATDSSDQIASFSTAGSYVDVAAPGVSILSTVPAADGSYSFYSGTSMATPHVAALAAQLKALDPQLTPDAVQAAMQNTAVDLGVTGRDDDVGYGRIRPVQALQSVLPPSVAPTTTAPATTAPATTAPATAPTSAAPTTAAPTSAAPTTTAPATTAPATPSATPTATSSPTPTPTTTPTSTPLVKPVVTSTASTRTVAYGTVVTTDFTVTAKGAPWGNRPVQLCVSAPGGGWTCAGATTTAQGRVRHVRTATATFRVRLLVSATAGSSAVSSPTYVYTTRASAGLARSGNRALLAEVTGAVGQRVSVQRLHGRNWTTVVTYAAVSSRTVAGLKAGYRYRLVVATTAAITGAQSSTVAL
jgi:serine protease